MALQLSGRKAKKDDNFKYEVIEKCGVIGDRGNGYNAELRYVKFGDKDPRYDVRCWKVDEDGEERMTKGFSMSGEELLELAKRTIILNGGLDGIITEKELEELGNE